MFLCCRLIFNTFIPVIKNIYLLFINFDEMDDKKKNITLTIHNKDKPKVYADIDMTRTIIRNLLSNVIKFTDHKGSISITIDKIPKYASISITDNGIGISKEIIENLFDINTTVTMEGTDGEKGSGLGLILSNEFVLTNGGKLSIESEPNKGSTFTFTLPLLHKS